MAKIKWKGGTLLAPLPPTMVSLGTMEESNIITIGWTGILNSTPPKTYISVRPSRYSYEILKEKKEFVINLTPTDLVRAADGCGIYTGQKVDKFKKYKLTKEPATEVSAPMIAECPLSIECRVTDVIPLGSHDMFMADIVAIDVDESLVDEKGELHLEKARLTAYAHGQYFALGKKIGSFGFSAKKRKPSGEGKSTGKKKTAK